MEQPNSTTLTFDVPEFAYYVVEGKLQKSLVLGVAYKLMHLADRSDFVLTFTVDSGGGVEFTGVVGEDIFRTKEEAIEVLTSAGREVDYSEV